MNKDLIAFLLFVFCLTLMTSIFLYYEQESKAQITMTAIKNGYCSSIHPSNNSLVLWNKCKEEKDE